MDGLWLAALSGAVSGGALLVGAAVAWFLDIPQRVVAGIMALGAGVLISTLAFELVEEAAADGGLVPTVIGFLAGAVLYVVADWIVSRPPKPKPPTLPANIAARRKVARLAGGSGVAIAIGGLIDGIPESIVMGLSVLQGGVSIPIVAAIAISNIPEGLASTAALKRGGSGGRAIAMLWLPIALVTVVAAVVGFVAFQAAPVHVVAFITTVAAGALLAMLCNTMIPEAFEQQHGMTGLWATVGFLGAFVLHELAG